MILIRTAVTALLARASVLRNSMAGAALLLSALAVVLTWPQAWHLGTRVIAHDDPLLSMWRLEWLAHALRTDPAHLFDGNIFSPHPRTLAYSDATLLEGLIAAPWLWAHVNPVLVYNLLLFGGIVSSGLGMFLLVRHLTGNPDAALVSAAIFALAPYRIAHLMHLELQWTMWMPLTLWAIHRVFDEGSMRHGVIAGAFLALQLLSCVYYGAFLAIIVAVFVPLLALSQQGRVRRALIPLCIGAILPAVVAIAYGAPYVANTQVSGTRDPGEIMNFSAYLSSYITAPTGNWLWGWTGGRFEGDERQLFPGVIAVALALLPFARRRRPRLVWIYLAITVVAIELSLGMNGTVYRWLHDHIWALAGFRAPARFGILMMCGLAVLAGFGYQSLQQITSAPTVVLIAALVAIGVEYGSSPVLLDEVPRRTPDVYRFVSLADRGVVIELPIVEGYLNPTYMFWSTRHWHPLVNGYSGFKPLDYAETTRRMRTFPDEASIARLRQLDVRYILVHETYFQQKERTRLMLDLARRPELVPGGSYHDWIGTTRVFELKP
ncbi:MAG TPA: hypothetical protein VKE96_02570 [Vicinamibacterales bacterium]|nr:hypothetical protein [Vicinamibacterales bacterium]